jgi:hypothetical protein
MDVHSHRGCNIVEYDHLNWWCFLHEVLMCHYECLDWLCILIELLFDVHLTVHCLWGSNSIDNDRWCTYSHWGSIISIKVLTMLIMNILTVQDTVDKSSNHHKYGEISAQLTLQGM